MAFLLAHLSDPHLAPLPKPYWNELIGKRVTGYLNWQRTRRFVHNSTVLAKIVADLKAHKPDHIAVTGDLANIALLKEYLQGRTWLENLGDAQHVSLVPGNHDAYVRDGMRNAIRQWGAYMSGDDGKIVFPYLRRRRPLAIIGLSTAVATAPFMATGLLGREQLTRLADTLTVLERENLFRVLLIHHPPVSAANRHKLLLDADELNRVIAKHGVDLLLHGHDHLHMLNWLPGPNGTRVPAVGVPSASTVPGMSHDDNAYNLYRIDGACGGWTCEAISRGVDAEGAVIEQKRSTLS